MSIIAQKRVRFAGLQDLSLKSLVTVLLQADQNYRSRRQLARLDAHQLADIGLHKL